MKKLINIGCSSIFTLKWDLKMKLTAFFLLVCMLQINATTYSQKTRISLDMNDVQLSEVLNRIETISEFKFFVDTQKIDVKFEVNIKANKEKIFDILDKLFLGTDITYEVYNKQILLKKVDVKPTKKSISIGPDQSYFETKILQQAITGSISDKDGTPLPGANILEKGTTNGTQADFDGNFSISIEDENAVLVISYIGFATKEVNLNGQTNLNVTLEESLAGLDEVIVTGYTGQSKRSITGAVETIKSDELAKSPATNVEQQLQGKISGVNITTSGNPAGGAQVRIRGLSNFGSRTPLYIIDGAPSDGGLSDINPDDIETLSVLKDASSASIYGARAANGVVLITTKKGRKGQPAKLTYSSYFAVDTDPGKLDVLNAREWGEMEWRGQRASVRGTPAEATFVPSHPTYGNGQNPVIPEFINGDPSLPYDPVTNRLMRSADTDWYDAVSRTAFGQNHNLSILGGGENSRYGVSFGYLNREGTLIENSFRRYSTRLNTEFSFLDDRLRIGENITIAYSENNGSNGVGGSRQSYNPLIPVWDEGGNFGGTLNGILGLQTNAINPVANQVRLKNAISRRWRIFGNAYMEADIASDFTFKSNVAVDYTQNNNTTFRPLFPEGGNPGNSLDENSSFVTSLTWTNTLNYSKNFGNHNFELLAGTEAIEIVGRNISFSGTGFFTEDPDFVSINTSGTTNSLNGAGTGRKLASLFGKFDYSYKDRYLINATVRRDGSSALGPNNRFDVFPAIGLGWIISDENFLTDSSSLNLLKLRAGWGTVGNQNSLGDFSFISNFSQDPNFTSTGYDIGATNSGDPANGIALLSRGNPDLVWESSETLNIGMDFALLEYKVIGSIEWYDRRTKDLLLQPPVPITGGAASPAFVNLGEIQNKGVDVSLSYNGKVGALDLGVTGIVSSYKNKVLDIDGNPESFFQGPGGNPNIIAARTQVGREIGSFYGRIVDGVIQDGPNAGNFDFRDIDNSGTINFEDQDFIGSPHPDFTYSLNLTANYKDFDFTLFFRGSQGNEIWAYDKLFTDFQFRSGPNRSTRVLDAWRPDNPTNTLAEFNLNTSNNNLQASSYYVEDGSYLRLQTLQLGYTFPDLGLGIEKFRVYLQGQNVFTFTNYSGIDPEVGENGGLELGVDRGGTYTVPRTFLLGLNLSL
jgi:TonB-linked SusC/RagA family outer membrane protein